MAYYFGSILNFCSSIAFWRRRLIRRPPVEAVPLSVAPGACECLNVIIEGGRCSQGIVPLHWTCVENSRGPRVTMMACLQFCMFACGSLCEDLQQHYMRKNLKDIWVEVNTMSKHAFRSFPVDFRLCSFALDACRRSQGIVLLQFVMIMSILLA